MSAHFFEVSDAIKHGVDKAVVLAFLKRGIEHNKANKLNQYDSTTWIDACPLEVSRILSYMTETKVNKLLKQLVKDGVIKKEKYNGVELYSLVNNAS